MIFSINGNVWKIEKKGSEELLNLYKQQSNEEDIYNMGGLTDFSQQKIYINENFCKQQQIRVLKHELTHCFIQENGLYNVPSYNEEMVCDLVSASNSFINSVVEKFNEENKQTIQNTFTN